MNIVYYYYLQLWIVTNYNKIKKRDIPRNRIIHIMVYREDRYIDDRIGMLSYLCSLS